MLSITLSLQTYILHASRGSIFDICDKTLE